MINAIKISWWRFRPTSFSCNIWTTECR